MTNQLKYCARCETSKERSLFAKNRTFRDGLNYTCKDCCKIIRAATGRKYRANYRKNNPLHHSAHRAIENAVRKKKLVRGVCRICKEPRAQAHHSDYREKFNVTWLCRSHHRAWHRVFIPERAVNA